MIILLFFTCTHCCISIFWLLQICPPPLSPYYYGFGDRGPQNWGITISRGRWTVTFMPAWSSTDDTHFLPANKGWSMLSQWKHWLGGRPFCRTCSTAPVMKYIDSNNFKRAIAMLKEETIQSQRTENAVISRTLESSTAYVTYKLNILRSCASVEDVWQW